MMHLRSQGLRPSSLPTGGPRPVRVGRRLLTGAAVLLGMSSAQADINFVVENYFDGSRPDAANYFGSNFDSSQVWLQFTNTGGLISYTDATTNQSVTVTDYAGVALSSVLNGSFTVGVGANSTRVAAALVSGGTNPFSSTLSPDPFSVSPSSNYAYALAEFTYLGNSFDNVDVSYIDSFAYPTVLTTSTGASAGWKPGTQAASVVAALGGVMPSGATSRIPTSLSAPGGARYVGTSKYLQSGVNFQDTPNATVSYSGPGYNDYLKFLQENAPQYDLPEGGTVQGWYLDYSGNNGYSGYLTVTGTDGNYGLQVSNVRVNTGSGGGQNTNTNSGRALGTAVNGTLTIAANSTQITLQTPPQTPPTPDQYTMTGPWTDMVISSGADLYENYQTSFGGGPVVTTTGSLAPGQDYASLASTFLATISAMMTTGMLGSETFNVTPSTNFWFGPEGIGPDSPLFSALWSNLPEGASYWDPYVEALIDFTEWEGYVFPFQDRFAKLPATDLTLVGVDTITWQLGVAVPEPSTVALFALAAGVTGFALRRRR